MNHRDAGWLLTSHKVLPVVGLVALALIISVTCHHSSAKFLTPAVLESGPLPEFAPDYPQLIYSSYPKDNWNRIFNLLFTRILKVRLSKEFPQAAPFKKLPQTNLFLPTEFSTRLFDQYEGGDRAIDPLYPSFLSSAGALQVLTEPNYSALDHVLADALSEPASREPTARALMQSDAWAAYDAIYRAHQNFADIRDFVARKAHLLKLLARLIAKIALSRNEISLLPRNSALAGEHPKLPDFFKPSSGWIEIEFVPQRKHDSAVNFRRAARLFVKPIVTPADVPLYLETLRDFANRQSREQELPENLAAVALVIENLLIDSQGEIVASPLIQDVQIRRFVRDDKGHLLKTELREYELSRRKLLSSPSTSGLVEFDETSAVFKAAAGNDYSFATPLPLGAPHSSPLMVKLSSRCADCHGIKQDLLMSLAIQEMALERMNPRPRVSNLDVNQDEHARYVIAQKMAREEFKSLSLDAHSRVGNSITRGAVLQR
jgi:hypothetical protein